MVGVKLDGVTKFLGEVKAVDNLTLEIQSGRIILRAGPDRLWQDDGAPFDRGFLSA